MEQVSPNRRFGGSAFVRMLARLAQADAPASRQTLLDRLGHWVGWTDAIALSAALGGSAVVAPGSARRTGMTPEEECARLRKTLAQALVQGEVPGDEGFAAYRQHYLGKQQMMENRIAPLRGRLRDLLGARSPELARLAAVDAVMERALGESGSRLFASVPGLLEGHYVRLRRAAEDAQDAPGWREAFRQDLRGLLLAELDVRFQPVEGLLAALRVN